MKTPGEILRQRHQAIEPKLDAIRREVVASLERPARTSAWREFIVSMRWHLAGLGAVWAVVLLLQLDLDSSHAFTMAGGKIPSTRLLVAALVENRREILELTDLPPSVPDAVVPGRRSEMQPALEVV